MESTQGLRERSLSRTKLHRLLSHIILSEHWVFTGPVIVTATLWNNCNKVPGESNLGNRGFSSDHSLRRLPILAGKAWRRECDGWPYCVCCGDPEREREGRVSASPLYPSYSDMLPSTPGGGQISYLKYANRCSLTDKPRGWQPRMTLSPIKLTICVNVTPPTPSIGLFFWVKVQLAHVNHGKQCIIDSAGHLLHSAASPLERQPQTLAHGTLCLT